MFTQPKKAIDVQPFLTLTPIFITIIVEPWPNFQSIPTKWQEHSFGLKQNGEPRPNFSTISYPKMQQVEKLNYISLKEKDTKQVNKKAKSRINWFVDEDLSLIPLTCTILWKELLLLKK